MMSTSLQLSITVDQTEGYAESSASVVVGGQDEVLSGGVLPADTLIKNSKVLGESYKSNIHLHLTRNDFLAQSLLTIAHTNTGMRSYFRLEWAVQLIFPCISAETSR